MTERIRPEICTSICLHRAHIAQYLRPGSLIRSVVEICNLKGTIHLFYFQKPWGGIETFDISPTHSWRLNDHWNRTIRRTGGKWIEDRDTNTTTSGRELANDLCKAWKGNLLCPLTTALMKAIGGVVDWGREMGVKDRPTLRVQHAIWTVGELPDGLLHEWFLDRLPGGDREEWYEERWIITSAWAATGPVPSLMYVGPGNEEGLTLWR